MSKKSRETMINGKKDYLFTITEKEMIEMRRNVIFLPDITTESNEMKKSRTAKKESQ